MTATELLENLTCRGIHLSVKGDRLRVDAPTGVVTDADRQALAQHKAELLAWMRSPAEINDRLVFAAIEQDQGLPPGSIRLIPAVNSCPGCEWCRPELRSQNDGQS